jgi:hypothetical protein
VDRHRDDGTSSFLSFSTVANGRNNILYCRHTQRRWHLSPSTTATLVLAQFVPDPKTNAEDESPRTKKGTDADAAHVFSSGLDPF